MEMRVELVFSGRTLEVLQDLQARTGKSVPDVVLQAVGFLSWVLQQSEEGKVLAMVHHATNDEQEYMCTLLSVAQCQVCPKGETPRNFNGSTLA